MYKAWVKKKKKQELISFYYATGTGLDVFIFIISFNPLNNLDMNVDKTVWGLQILLIGRGVAFIWMFSCSRDVAVAFC